jgi:hypothetical protein
LDKVKRLEETIQSERANRDAALQRERQMWEREVRILREALAPFYSNEKELRRKITDIEDRLEGNYDEQVRLRERVIAVDDITMSIEHRVDELEGHRPKKRRAGRNQSIDDVSSNDIVSSGSSLRQESSSIDERSIRTPSSRALSPNGPMVVTVDTAEPRSSGILNLVDMSRSTPLHLSQRFSPTQEEPRSSGFLNFDLAERLLVSQKAASEKGQEATTYAMQLGSHSGASSAGYARSNPDLSTAGTSGRSPRDIAFSKIPSVDVVVLPGSLSPRKRKHHVEHIALDVLANVSAASPLIR